ncbi:MULTISPECIES: hypothetical protein [Stenotrophomonas]|uniref:hypothetical protein n=1 Tax=Stenotrophomonas TaxID=40323 RepID=UPI000871FEB0|nr:MULTISPECIES: hypothetical protein [Stenotrophomonas]OEY99739.1 hypothetical protein BIY45_15265 [Stenotrophomonas sp. BIIR7]
MNINNAGMTTAGTHAVAAVEPTVSLLGDAREQELGRREGTFLQFCISAKPLVCHTFRTQIAAELEGYLEQGFLRESDADGPVQRLVAEAEDEEGVDPDEVNLGLREGVLVFGFYNCHGCGDRYYACMPGKKELAFFSICIESGVATSGPYDIFVSAPMDWSTFLADLPPA